jgi:2-polyprenyl-3-methyl-5-hydroxy-6-metoxy-1,4-benzoquinol methylase
MSSVAQIDRAVVEARARRSLGTSNGPIYKMVVRALEERSITDGVLVDVGCGKGNLCDYVRPYCSRYVGVDVIRYEEFSPKADFELVDLDTGRVSMPDETADVVISVETIEHLENPRLFMRELVRLTKPGGWVVVTTPNQQSLLSLLSLIVKGQFAAFQEADYPAHLTALLEIDLKRIATESGLTDIAFSYSHQGRVIFTPKHYPKIFAGLFPRAFSDNLVVIGRKPDG